MCFYSGLPVRIQPGVVSIVHHCAPAFLALIYGLSIKDVRKRGLVNCGQGTGKGPWGRPQTSTFLFFQSVLRMLSMSNA